MVVGVGKGDGLTERQFEVTGGEEQHQLALVQHNDYLRGQGGYLGTESVGRDINIMAPFVPLYYCQKNS
jgi:hypothetical protein